MIRYYEEIDIDQIAKIIVEGWKNAYKGIIDQDYLDKLDYKERAERIKTKYQKQKAIVYEENNIIKGYCRFGENRDEEKEYGEIYALYIKYDERQKGIGKKLVQNALKILNENSYKEVVIWCLKDNTQARKFYEKIGGKLYKEKQTQIGDRLYYEVSYIYKGGVI